jgi:hypothetical protein
MNTMEKLMETVDKSMNSANYKFQFQISTCLLQNVANSEEMCPRLKK